MNPTSQNQSTHQHPLDTTTGVVAISINTPDQVIKAFNFGSEERHFVDFSGFNIEDLATGDPVTLFHADFDHPLNISENFEGVLSALKANICARPPVGYEVTADGPIVIMPFGGRFGCSPKIFTDIRTDELARFITSDFVYVPMIVIADVDMIVTTDTDSFAITAEDSYYAYARYETHHFHYWNGAVKQFLENGGDRNQLIATHDDEPFFDEFVGALCHEDVKIFPR